MSADVRRLDGRGTDLGGRYRPIGEEKRDGQLGSPSRQRACPPLTPSPMMFSTRLFASLLALLLLAPTAVGQARIAEALQAEMASMGPLDVVQAVVVFDRDGAPRASDLQALRLTGVVKGFGFESLPMAGVLATRSTINAIAALPTVRTIWLNEELSYFNDGDRELTGVNRARVEPAFRQGGLPISGRGVTVMVNDSGIDATHADLAFGSKVVENVQGLTNLQALVDVLPVTYLEGQLNTDTNSGHGTHCAGTVAGTGARSGGLYEGVAPGADLVGYGSGGGLFILDALGGLDYALANQNAFENRIRVISNSWGSSGTFDHQHPVVEASYRLYRAGINVVFAAGNDGGEDTHNPYSQAPWVISVAAGNRSGQLADFSSRGKKGVQTAFTMYDGTTWTAVNEPTITAPGVDVISTRAITNGTANGGERDLELIDPAYLPFYTAISGTSMATPHISGIIALMLEAKPSMNPDKVRETLRATATNMPGREEWEVGSGYVNAYAALQATLRLHPLQFGRTLNFGNMNAGASVSAAGSQPFSLFYSPVGTNEVVEFEVTDPAISRVTARAVVGDNTVAIVLHDPAGNRYGSAISIPVLGETVVASAPGMAGTWTLEVRGIGSVSGIPTDPLGITNGTSVPGQVEGTISFLRTDGYTGIDDMAGHERAGDVQYGISRRLFDATQNGFKPGKRLTRADLARYLTMGAGIRQSLPINGVLSFPDVKGKDAPWVEAATAQGGALRDRAQLQDPVILADGGAFAPTGYVTRAEMAYAFVQALGLQEAAANYTGDVTVEHEGTRVALMDQDDIPAVYRGYVQLAIDLALLDVNARERRGVMEFRALPNLEVSRLDYAIPAALFYDAYVNGFDLTQPEGAALTASLPTTATADLGVAELALSLSGPNPFRGRTTLSLTLPAESDVQVTVFDAMGREVARVAEGAQSAGTHALTWDATGLAAGTYLVRAEAGGQAAVQRLTVVR